MIPQTGNCRAGDPVGAGRGPFGDVGRAAVVVAGGAIGRAIIAHADLMALPCTRVVAPSAA